MEQIIKWSKRKYLKGLHTQLKEYRLDMCKLQEEINPGSDCLNNLPTILNFKKIFGVQIK